MLWLLVSLVLLESPPEGIFSGPQAGEKTPGFKVLDLNGPTAGSEVDHVTEWKGAPTLICFIHELTRPGAQLMRRLDDYWARNKGAFETLFVGLADDPQAAERRLTASLRSLQMKSLASISVEGKEGPGSYGLNKDVLLTVILAKDNTVVANWALVSPNETDFPKIQALLDKLTEPALDTPAAMKAEILRLRAELAALRAEFETLRRRQPERMMAEGREKAAEKDEKTAGKKPLPGKAPDDPQLRDLVRRLIRPDAEPAEVDQVITEIEAYVRDNADLQHQTADAISLVDHLGYGTDYAKSARKKLLERYRKEGTKEF